MVVFETWLVSDISQPVAVKELSGNLFSADNNGNLIGVKVMNGEEPASLTGNVSAYIIRGDGQTVVTTGTLEENKAWVILPASAYVVVGRVSIVIKVGETTVGACTGSVYKTTTDEIVDPGHVIPSLAELLAQIAACEQATADANAAATLANNKAALANEKAELADSKATLADTAAGTANAAAELAVEKAGLADAATTAANAAAELANTKAELADTKAGVANDAAESADAAATLATTAAGNADTATTNANNAASKINNMTVAATGLAAGVSPTATISDVSGHKHILFGIPKGDKGDPGKDFHIARTFTSISQMNAYDPAQDPNPLEEYDFAMIDAGSVQDPDTGKLYCYEPENDPIWRYIGDLSGAQGIQGPTGATGATGNGISNTTLNDDYTLTILYTNGTSYTSTSIRGATGPTGETGAIGATPDFTIGTVTTVEPDQPASATITGTAEDPVLNLSIPRGQDGTTPGDMTGATASTAGTHGLVPAPSAGDEEKFLRGDGTWSEVGSELPQVTLSDNDKVLQVVNGLWNIGTTKIDKNYSIDDFSRIDFKTSGTTQMIGQLMWSDGENYYYSYFNHQYILNKLTSTWDVKNWNGYSSIVGDSIWTDGENIYYSSGSDQYVLDKSTSTWNAKTWNGYSSIVGSCVWTDGENIYYSTAANQYVLDKSTSTWSAKTWNGYSGTIHRDYIWTDGDNIYLSNNANQYVLNKSTSTWSAKTWNGFTPVSGKNYIWTDGDNIYYSFDSAQYVLNKSTSTWSTKTWTGFETPRAYNIWTAGSTIYYSYYAAQYILNKTTSKWITKNWVSGFLTNFQTDCVWTDGDNIYYSYGTGLETQHYIFNKSTSTWSAKTWNGYTNFSGANIWTDGENIYYSSSSNQYVLDKSTSTWNAKTWNGYSSIAGESVWTDGENIYYSNAANQYVLDKSTSTWSAKTWNGFTNIYGSRIWKDGDNVYYSGGSAATQYVLDKSTSTWSAKTWNGITSLHGYYVWTDGEYYYYSYSTSQRVLSDKSTSTWSAKTWHGFSNFVAADVWTDGENIYVGFDYKYNKGASNPKVLLGENGEFDISTYDDLPRLLPKVTTTDNNKILKVTNGEWTPSEDHHNFTGADGTNAGTAGLVPAPTATDNTKYLKGDGTWGTVDVSGFAPIDSPAFINSISMGRAANSTVGSGSVAFGSAVVASGDYSHAEGYYIFNPMNPSASRRTAATGWVSHAEGMGAIASGNYSHAEGYGTNSNGDAAHSENYYTTASGDYSHAENYYTEASGQSSHAEGGNTTAAGAYSHAGGSFNIADSYDTWSEWTASTAYVVGDKVKRTTTSNDVTTVDGYICKTAHTSGSSFSATYWTYQDGRMNYAEIIGNGTSSNAKSNARVLDWEGNEYLKGDLYVGCNADSTGGTKVAKINDIPDISGKADKTDTVLNTTLSRGRVANSTVGTASFAFGNSVTASGASSHAEGEGTTASGSCSHAEGAGTTASGGQSHSEGSGTTASESGSHAEGGGSRATGAYSHAEGSGTQASGSSSHAEGASTTASGYTSHAEGWSTIASGAQSHAEGVGTQAVGTNSHVSGMHNVADSYDSWDEWVANTSYDVGDKVKRTVSSVVTGYICNTANSDSTFTSSNWNDQSGRMNYAEIVGNGIANSPSNARALDWEGNEYLAGDVYVGCSSDSTGGSKLAKVSELPDISGKIDSTEKGANNGVAELDSSGKVPTSQLPSYVDDVLEYSSQSAFPATGETGKIYVALDTNLTYRWSGSAYVEISPSLALGETSSTAYRGDRGKTAYDHATDSSRLTTAQTSGLYKLSVTAEGHVGSVTVVQKSDITALGIPGENTQYSDMTGASSSAAGTHGLVPAPATGDNEKYLRGDGTWATVSGGGGTAEINTVTFSIATTDWTLSSGAYTASVSNSGFDGNTTEVVQYDASILNLNSGLTVTKDNSTYDTVFTTNKLPSGTITGTILSCNSTLANASGVNF